VNKRTKKVSLTKAIDQLTALAEKQLATLPEEEQDARIAAFARRSFKTGRGVRTKPSAPSRTRASRASNRGR